MVPGGARGVPSHVPPVVRAVVGLYNHVVRERVLFDGDVTRLRLGRPAKSELANEADAHLPVRLRRPAESERVEGEPAAPFRALGEQPDLGVRPSRVAHVAPDVVHLGRAFAVVAEEGRCAVDDAVAGHRFGPTVSPWRY